MSFTLSSKTLSEKFDAIVTKPKRLPDLLTRLDT